jgi:hypothetical protein
MLLYFKEVIMKTSKEKQEVPAAESVHLVRSRKKLEERLAKLTSKTKPEVIKEKKDELHRQLGRRGSTDRAKIDKATLSAFANGEGIAEESGKIASMRSKLSGS